MTVWFVRKRPTGVSFFRDAFPYLERNLKEGSLWVAKRSKAECHTTKDSARRALLLARRYDENTFIVRVCL